MLVPWPSMKAQQEAEPATVDRVHPPALGVEEGVRVGEGDRVEVGVALGEAPRVREGEGVGVRGGLAPLQFTALTLLEASTK